MKKLAHVTVWDIYTSSASNGKSTMGKEKFPILSITIVWILSI